MDDKSMMEKLLGLNWRTSSGATLAAAGGVLALQTSGTWKTIGSVMVAVGTCWMGFAARDRSVTGEQMAIQKEESGK